MTRAIHLISFLLLTFSSPIFAQNSETKKITTPPLGLWERPVVIGASLSNGYDHTERIGGPNSEALALHLYLEKLLKNENTKFKNYGNRLAFISAPFILSQQVINANLQDPTIVIAVDQLFWQLYGRFPSSEARLSAFKKALKTLDSIQCPLVIGNIPNAIQSVGKMLAPSQVPDLDTINQANQLLNAWVKERITAKKATTIVDLAKFMELCVSDQEIKLKHITYPAGTTKRFLQADMLHPTPAGVTAISNAILDALEAIELLDKKDRKITAISSL